MTTPTQIAETQAAEIQVAEVQAAEILAAHTRSHPIALWHLLSLDAPAVAALWTWFVAHAAGIALDRTVPLTMFVAVWLLYAVDRLLDARLLDARLLDASSPLASEPALEARHRFHHAYRRRFWAVTLLGAVALVPLLASMPRRTLLLYLPLGLLTISWFAVVHLVPASERLPKELAVGILFSAAVFLPALADSHGRASLLLSALLFAALLSLNGLFIFDWEHLRVSHANRLTRRLLRRLRPLTFTLALASLLRANATGLAIGLACAALLLLDRYRDRFDRVTLRTAADLALLTPLFLLPSLR